MKNNTEQTTQTANGIIRDDRNPMVSVTGIIGDIEDNDVYELLPDDIEDDEDDYELIDINYLVTGGREGFMAYEVSTSLVEGIYGGDIVFADTEVRPEDGDIIVTSRWRGMYSTELYNSAQRGLCLVKAGETSERDDSPVFGVVRGRLTVYDGAGAKHVETKPNKPESAPETADNVHHTRFSA